MRMLHLAPVLLLLAQSARAEEAVLYLVETDPRPLEIDGRPAAVLPLLRFELGQRDPGGAIRLVAREINGIGGSIPELSAAGVAADPGPSFRSPSPELYQVLATFQGAKRWDVTFDLTPDLVAQDGRVGVVATGREHRSDGAARAEFRRELKGWFLIYPGDTQPVEPDPAKQRGAFGPR